jgi:toxin ParE1/3/4
MSSLRWTPEALHRLREIEEFIAADHPRAAANFIAALIGKAESLRGQSQRGRIVPEFGTPAIREIVFKGYRIVYRVNKGAVIILTVFESHRQARHDEIGPDAKDAASKS